MTRHGRFLIALGLGLAAGAGSLALQMPFELAALSGVDVTFIVYLALMLHLASSTSPEDLRRRAESADEGVVLILLLGSLTVAISLIVILRILAVPHDMMSSGLGQGLTLTAVPLGWAMLQVMMAFHYGHLFYHPGPQARGLDFPGTPDPGPWDFLYLAFAVGMTAQVADVVTRNAGMRRVVLAHGIASFFYNTVILALAINAALALGG